MTNIADSIKGYLDEYTAIWPFSGVVYVVKEGEVLFQNAYGMACHEFAIPNTMDTCFALASISKQFTCFAVMQLYEKGLLDIDAPVNNYLPDALKIDPRITAHHLMSHTSGLYNFYTFQDDFFQEYNRSNYSQLDYFNKYINQPLSFEPGSKYEYCNAGYNMLALLVEAVSGQTFSDYLEKNIFTPLEMENTTLDDGANIIKNKAYAYTMDRDTVVRSQYYNEKFSIGAGGLVSNCSDLYKWYQCLKSGSLLSDRTYKRIFSENLNRYCYGLIRDVKYERTRYLHGGDHLGIATYMQSFFEDDTCIIILSNNDFTNQNRLGDSISELIFTAKTAAPGKLPEIELDETLAKKYEGVYLDKKIELRRYHGAWEFVRFDGNLHIAIYPVGNHQFSCKWREQFKPYTLTESEDGVFEFFGFKKKERVEVEENGA